MVKTDRVLNRHSVIVESSFRMRLAYHLEYLSSYIPVYQSPEFENVLRLNHRQYYANLLSGITMFTDPCREHQNKIQDLIRTCLYELYECSASKENELLFTNAVAARLLTQMLQRKQRGRISS